MKWFVHDSNAHEDSKLEKLLMKYGSDGYALYFYCLEIIAGELSPENITFELEHDAEILAYKLKIDSLRVEEIMNYCVSLGLFQFNPATKRIMCLTLAKRVDIYMSRNPEIAKIRSKIKDIPKVFEQTSKKVLPHDMILHDITLHDMKRERKKDVPTPISEVEEPMTMDTPVAYAEGNPYTKISANQYNSFIDKCQMYNIPGFGIKMMMDHYAEWIQKMVLEHPKSRDYQNRSAYHNLIGWVMKSWWFDNGCKLPVPEKYKNKVFEKITKERFENANTENGAD